MRNHSRSVTLNLLLLGALSLVGCQKRDQWQRVVVTGVVSFDGEPIARGRIRFTPTAGTSGPVTVGTVSNGQYRCDHLGGVSVGTHRVQIWAFDPNAPEFPGPGGPPPKRILPEKFNDASELEVTIANDAGVVQQDFDLQP